MSEQSQKTKESRFAGFFAKALAKKAVTATVLIAVVCAVGIIGMRSYLNSEVKTTKLGFEDTGISLGSPFRLPRANTSTAMMW